MTSPIKIWRDHKKLARLLGKSGTIVAWTIVRIAPDGFEKDAPYPIVLVKLKNEENILTQMVDFNNSQLKSGQKVVTVVRRTVESPLSEIVSYGLKVRPV